MKKALMSEQTDVTIGFQNFLDPLEVTSFSCHLELFGCVNLDSLVTTMMKNWGFEFHQPVGMYGLLGRLKQEVISKVNVLLSESVNFVGTQPLSAR
jgi:hypothetical protein